MLDSHYERLIAETSSCFSSADKEFVDKFESGSHANYVLGTNCFAEEIIKNYPVKGVIDDFSPATEFMGKPIFRADQVEKDALIVSGNILGRPLTVKSRLDGLGLENINYFLFRRIASKPLIEVCNESDFVEDILSNIDAYEYIYGLLADKESKDTLRKIVNFKITARLEWMNGFADIQHRQYFEDFLSLQENGETFLDVGGHDGYTSTCFAKQCPGYKKIHVFEPNLGIHAMLKSNLRQHSNVLVHDFGLSDSSQTLRFSSNGSASRVDEEGDEIISVKRLDDFFDDDATLIKMDIEGGEVPALEGARSIIERMRPRLAISAYHLPADIRSITSKVLDIRKDWKIFLRHYTEGVTETVLFFVPDV